MDSKCKMTRLFLEDVIRGEFFILYCTARFSDSVHILSLTLNRPRDHYYSKYAYICSVHARKKIVLGICLPMDDTRFMINT